MANDAVKLAKQVLSQPQASPSVKPLVGQERDVNLAAFQKGNHPDVPHIAYHGTDKSFQEFSDKFRGSSTNAKSATMGHWFTDVPRVAQSYAHYAATDVPVRKLIEAAEKAGRRQDWGAHDRYMDEAEKLEQHFRDPENEKRGQNIMPVHLSMKNPHVIDANGGDFNDLEGGLTKHIMYAKRKGHDGLIVKNLDDAAGLTNVPATHLMVFKPQQIKSATGNQGTFNPSNPDITKAHGGDVEPIHILHEHFGYPHFREGGDVDAGQDGITAYHGSPHQFDRFSTGSIGTGEGAQAYGHGLYFAQAEPTAIGYRNRLSEQHDPRDAINDVIYQFTKGKVAAPTHENIKSWMTDNFALKPFANDDRITRRVHEIINSNDLDDAHHSFKELDNLLPAPSKGHMYEVHINAHPNELLDWDKPLSEQSKHIQDFAKSVKVPESAKRSFAVMKRWQEGNEDPNFPATGSILHNIMSDYGTDPEKHRKASETMYKAGIKGIKYLDANSRAGDYNLTHNYVIFNDKDVHIKRRYAQGGDVAQPSEQTFQNGEKYNGHIPEIKYLPTHMIEHSGQAGEVHNVSEKIAQNMDFSQPVEATAFRYGKNHDEFEPSVMLSDGHHRLAAAKQIGRPHLPVKITARNAKGEKLNAMKALSDEIEQSLTNHSKKNTGGDVGHRVHFPSLSVVYGE